MKYTRVFIFILYLFIVLFPILLLENIECWIDLIHILGDLVNIYFINGNAYNSSGPLPQDCNPFDEGPREPRDPRGPENTVVDPDGTRNRRRERSAEPNPVQHMEPLITNIPESTVDVPIGCRDRIPALSLEDRDGIRRLYDKICGQRQELINRGQDDLRRCVYNHQGWARHRHLIFVGEDYRNMRRIFTNENGYYVEQEGANGGRICFAPNHPAWTHNNQIMPYPVVINTIGSWINR